MRIISGTLGGRVLKVPQNLPVRPTTDRTKESLFNIIGNTFDFEGLSILELCCGTGNIGIEFWSRGATEIVAVDKDKRCVQAVKNLYKEFDITGGTVLQADITKFVASNSGQKSFDIVFIDPPYAMANQSALLATIFAQKWCKAGGWVILEHTSMVSFEAEAYFLFCRKYGSSSISFFGEMTDDAHL